MGFEKVEKEVLLCDNCKDEIKGLGQTIYSATRQMTDGPLQGEARWWMCGIKCLQIFIINRLEGGIDLPKFVELKNKGGE